MTSQPTGSFWAERYAQVPQTLPTGSFGQQDRYVNRSPDIGPKIAVSQFATQSSYWCIRRAGGTPVEVTGSTPLSVLQECGAVLIPGGLDVNPALYGEANTHSQEPSPARDEFELQLIDYALQHNMGVLGICRGHQLLNVALGGSLIQHMEEMHSYKHPVKVAADSPILGTIKNQEIVVNSLHHQAVNRLGEGLRATAWHPNGTIEAIEHTERRFVVGVQWHPEMSGVSNRFDKAMDALIWRRLVNVARDVIRNRSTVTA